MLFIGNLVYVLCLLTNALAILSDDRFLARIGLSTSTYDPAFGAGADANSVKAKLVALIASVRMVMRRTFRALPPVFPPFICWIGPLPLLHVLQYWSSCAESHGNVKLTG
ncbi:Protein transport protein YOS1 [Trichoderma ghanense]|uniref:Protein transport protein YOS1 n=1 Tax=Trichoderma ghanense TaxID=65468 RepID=A0ABY2GYX2_9HYPO